MHTQNLIIGFGKAGKTLAADLAKHGQNVVLVEQSPKMYGGTCINIGCIPSKKLIVEGEQNIANPDKSAVFTHAMSAKNTLITKLCAANFAKVNQLEHAQVITAHAQFLDEHTVQLTNNTGNQQIISADRIFINTGAQSASLHIEGANLHRVYDSEGLLSLPQRPNHLLIIGGGYIGLEFAFMYQAFGSEVTILDAGETFLPREDRDIAQAMLDALDSKNIRVITNARPQSISQTENVAIVQTTQGAFSADAVLVAVGRTPNTQNLALDKAGIATNDRGFILTDDYLRVKGKNHIWAMGDVAGSPMFTYISLDDYRIVRDQLLGHGQRTRNDRAPFPTAVFTQPPLSHIGMTESAAAQSGKTYTVCKITADSIPKAKVLNQTQGLLKAIVDNETGEILGATLFCAESHELINLFKMAIDHHIPAHYIKNQIFTHPTIAEGLNDLFANI